MVQEKDIYNYSFKVKLLIILSIVFLSLGEWFFYKALPEFFRDEINLVTESRLAVYSFFLSVGVFFILNFCIKGYLVIKSKLDDFFLFPVILIYLSGLFLIEYAIINLNGKLLQGSGLLVGIPSLFMSAVIFKELLIKNKLKKGEKPNEEIQK
ncbi:MAG: hypothetical protein PHV06_10395 [bacterium]|nr:hypothetical protein [bacterium]